MTKRYWWVLFTIVLLAGTTCLHAASFDGALGANFNGEYQDINYADLNGAGVKWIRGFVTMTRLNAANIEMNLPIRDSLAAKQHGFHVILTLKWNFRKTGIPDAGTERYRESINSLNAVLARVMGKVDILEIGNEPYVETPPDEHDSRLNKFYESMAEDVIAFKQSHCKGSCSTVLFMGALNRLDVPKVRQAPWVRRWLAFVKATPEIQGVDIHPHVASYQQSVPFVKFVSKRIRPNQQFLVTEFSLVWYWKAHMADRVPASFAKRYGIPADTQMWQAINDAIRDPFSQAEWNDLLTGSPWFAAQKLYIQREMHLFRQTNKLAVATYGFEQGASMTRKFGPKSVPWLLNSVYARRTVRKAPGGIAPTNPYWLAAFKQLTRAESSDLASATGSK